MKKIIFSMLCLGTILGAEEKEKEFLTPDRKIFISASYLPGLHLVGSVLSDHYINPLFSTSLAFRQMNKTHGFEIGLSSIMFKTLSAEAAYLPHVTLEQNKYLYLGIGAGVLSILNDSTVPAFFIKPGFQFPLNKDRSSAGLIEMKIGFPELIGMSFGVGF